MPDLADKINMKIIPENGLIGNSLMSFWQWIALKKWTPVMRHFHIALNGSSSKNDSSLTLFITSKGLL